MERVSQLVNDFSALEANFDGVKATAWMLSRPDIPIAFAAAYVVFVFAGRAVMRNAEPLQFKSLFTLWNFLLSAFSIYGGLTVIPFFLRELTTRGERHLFCTNGKEAYLSGPVGFWIVVFALSKIPELIDTVFLVIRKRPVIFLHWWHHTTVLLFSWFALGDGVPAGPWFAAMNYFVHSIMYTYYFGMSFGGPLKAIVKPFAMSITVLQLVQMVFGLYVTLRIQLILNSEGPAACAGADPMVNLAGLGMYASYFVLFANFFYHNYIKAGGRKRGGGPADAKKAKAQ
uniref:Elongation of fatty acids protein n=1 Tax=Neobodo designis TaxID=312471 RepID=A0A7S1MS62_NEODS